MRPETLVKHILPALPYAYDALEPFIDAQTLEIHHTRHHQAYIDGLNNALERLDVARTGGQFASIKQIKQEIAFHGSGHILHSLYWQSMIPGGLERPWRVLIDALVRDFGSIGVFEKEFRSSALTVEGSGWAILALLDGRLQILTAEKHQNLTLWGAIPLLACDVWEHAYYLRYQNRRADYIDAFMKVIDWVGVENRYNEALAWKA